MSADCRPAQVCLGVGAFWADRVTKRGDGCEVVLMNPSPPSIENKKHSNTCSQTSSFPVEWPLGL